MKIAVSGSLGNIGKPLTQILVSAGHEVTVISSSEERVAEIENLGAKAAIGSVNDAAFLESVFLGADAVFAMTPPNMGGVNIVSNTTDAGKAYANAFQKAGVKRVVMLSSVGADFPEGTGPIKGIHNIEKIYEELGQVSITFLRAGYFYINFYNDIPLIKGAGVLGGNYPEHILVPVVSPEDIAVAAAEELQSDVFGHNVRYIVSDVRTPADFAKVLGAAIGKPALPWVEFTDDQSLQGMIQAGLPEEMAGLYTEMGKGLKEGKLTSDFEQSGSPVTGKVKLEDFAKSFAAKF